MKTKLKVNNATQHQQDSKLSQLPDLTELTDQEAELVLGGWGTPDPPPLLGSGGGGGGWILGGYPSPAPVV